MHFTPSQWRDFLGRKVFYARRNLKYNTQSFCLLWSWYSICTNLHFWRPKQSKLLQRLSPPWHATGGIHLSYTDSSDTQLSGGKRPAILTNKFPPRNQCPITDNNDCIWLHPLDGRMDGGTHIPFILQDYVQVCSQGQNKFPLNDHEMYVGRRQSCQSAKVQPNYSKAAAIISAKPLDCI